MPVDTEVHALAKRFTGDLPFAVKEEDTQLLAETIQDMIEDYIRLLIKQEAEGLEQT